MDVIAEVNPCWCPEKQSAVAESTAAAFLPSTTTVSYQNTGTSVLI